MFLIRFFFNYILLATLFSLIGILVSRTLPEITPKILKGIDATEKLRKLENKNFFIEIIIAITAPGSALSGLWFLETQTGLALWKVLSVVAAVAAFLKPFLKLSQKIKFYEQTISGYRALEYDLYDIILKVREEDSYSQNCIKLFDSAIKKKKVLATNPPEIVPDKKLVNMLYQEVIEEIPSISFYIPKEV